jgi:hypothetical protein
MTTSTPTRRRPITPEEIAEAKRQASDAFIHLHRPDLDTWIGQDPNRRKLTFHGIVAAPPGQPGTDQLAWRGPKNLSILLSEDHTPHGHLLHISVAYPDRLPSWRDLREIKDAFFGPDKAAAQILPETSEYVNVHPFVLHLWEIPDGWHFNATV